MAETISFPEYTCWNDEDFRHVRKPVMFRVTSVGRGVGRKVDAEFQADFGVWYHNDDDGLIWLLGQACRSVKWENYIYHRKWDHSGIDVCDPDDDALVARVEVRQYRGRRLDVLEKDLGSNVVRLDDYRTSRLNDAVVSEEVDQLFEAG